MANYIIGSGQMTGYTLHSGDGLTVLKGGTSVNSVIGAQAGETIDSGGVDSGATVSGNTAQQAVNGSANGATLISGGLQIISSGGTATNTVAFQSGEQEITSGGSAVGTTLSGGTQFELSGGAVTGTTIDSGGTLVFGGGILSNTTVNSGGSLSLLLDRNGDSGTFAGGNAVVAGGTVVVGGAVVGTVHTDFIIDNNTPIAGINGGVASGVAVAVVGQGVTNELTISSGGFEAISGGTASGAELLAGASATVGGTLELLGGDTLAGHVSMGFQGTVAVGAGYTLGNAAPIAGISGGIAATVMVDVLSLGSASGLIVSGGTLTVSGGGVASGTTVATGILIVSGSGTTSATAISGAAATETVSAGGLSVSATVVAGRQFVNGSAFAASVAGGGDQIAAAGGIISGTQVGSGGNVTVLSGGTVEGVTVSSGGTETITNNATASATLVLSGGYEVVSSGGTASGVTIDSGATLAVCSGGVLEGTVTILSGGTLDATQNYVVTPTTPVIGISGGIARGITLELSLTGSASGTTVDSGGLELVGGAGTAIGTTVGGGGTLETIAVISNTTVGSGGTLDLLAGSVLDGTTTMLSGSVLEVGSGATLGGTTAPIAGVSGGVANGVTVAVLASGTASGMTIDGGGDLTVAAGGSLAGSLTFAGSGGKLVVSGSSTPSATISGFAAGDTIDLANLSATSATYANGVLSLSSGGATVATLNLAGSYGSTHFAATPDGATGTDVTIPSLTNDLNGDGISDTLMEQTGGGALVLDEISGGQMGYTLVGGLGSQWQFEGEGPIAGDGKDQFLLWYGTNDSPIYGSIVLGEDSGGSASYSLVGSIGPQWQFEGVGPLAGGSNSDVLLWYGTDDSPSYGALVVGADQGGSMSYTDIGALGPEWQFQGVGGYLNNGSSDFLIWDTSSASPIDGALVIGQDVGGSAQYTLVGGLGPSTWQFKGSGDLLNDGKESFLIWDANSSDPNYGALVVGEVNAGSVGYTQIGAIGPEWQFLGIGDYDGKSPAEFLMRDGNSGALVLGTIANGTIGYALVGAVGPSTWDFHTTNIATLA